MTTTTVCRRERSVTHCAKCSGEHLYQRPFRVEPCEGCPQPERIVYDDFDDRMRVLRQERAAVLDELTELERASIDAVRAQELANARPFSRARRKRKQ